MSEIVAGISSLAGLIEKGGVIVVMMIVIYFLVRERIRLVRELTKAYRQRDRARAIQIRYRTELDRREVRVDISDIEQMFKDDLAEEATA